MGSRLTEEDEQSQTSATPYGDIFDEFLPHYMAMGMTYEEYWDGEASMKTAYRKAYAIRIENEQWLADRQNWFMGQYLIRVLQAVPLLVGGINVKHTTQLPDYPGKPFYETMEEEKKAEVQKKKKEDQTKLAMAMFQAGVEKFNRNFQKRQEAQEKAGTGQ